MESRGGNRTWHLRVPADWTARPDLGGPGDGTKIHAKSNIFVVIFVVGFVIDFAIGFVGSVVGLVVGCV